MRLGKDTVSVTVCAISARPAPLSSPPIEIDSMEPRTYNLLSAGHEGTMLLNTALLTGLRSVVRHCCLLVPVFDSPPGRGHLQAISDTKVFSTRTFQFRHYLSDLVPHAVGRDEVHEIHDETH